MLHTYRQNKLLTQCRHKLTDFLKAWYSCLDWVINNILEITLVDNDLIFIKRFHGNIRVPFGKTRCRWEDKIKLLLQKQLVNRAEKPQDKVQGHTSLLTFMLICLTTIGEMFHTSKPKPKVVHEWSEIRTAHIFIILTKLLFVRCIMADEPCWRIFCIGPTRHPEVRHEVTLMCEVLLKHLPANQLHQAHGKKGRRGA
jgi:hypothetical protein